MKKKKTNCKTNPTNANRIAKFKRFYLHYFSEKTLEKYIQVLEQLLTGNIKISSASKWKHYKAVKQHAEKIKIPINEYIPEKWRKRGDNIQGEIIDKYIDKNLLDEIIKNCPKSPQGNELKLAIKIAYNTGMRLSEILEMEGKNIHKVKNHIKIFVSGKGGKTRKVFIKKEAQVLLENFNSFSIDIGYIELAITRISERLKKKFSFHSLRHSFAINFIKDGGDIALLQKQLGHTNLAITSQYLIYYDNIEALEKLGF